MANPLIIADSGLISAAGHNIAAFHTLSGTLGTSNIVCFAHEDIDDELLEQSHEHGLHLQPFFKTYLYDGFGRNWTIPEAQSFVHSLAKEYLKLFQKLQEDNVGHAVLHHTMDWPHILALALALSQCKFSQKLRQIVFLMFNPGVEGQRGMVAGRPYLQYRIALSLLVKQKHVQIYTSCREFSEYYQGILELREPVAVHPCFFFNPPLKKVSKTADQKADFLRLILYLGDAKAEKGFCDLPDLLDKLLPFLDSRADVVIHYNLNALLASDALRETAEALKRFAEVDQRVTVCNRFLPEQEMMELLNSGSLVLFNYNKNIYAHKSSGVLYQACSMNIPTVIIGESWLSREARRINPFFRTFDTMGDFVSELKRGGRIKFSKGEIDAAYRQELFKPLEDFFLHDAGVGRSVQDRSKPCSAIGGRKVLFVDKELPNPRSNAAGHAAWQEIVMLQELGFSISFIPLDGCYLSAEELHSYRERKLEVLCRPEHTDALNAVAARGKEFDIIFITRFNVAEPLVRIIREAAPEAKIILNVADLHFLREMRKAKVTGDDSAKTMAESLRRIEFDVLGQVDLVLTYSDVEQRMIEAHFTGLVNVAICPWVEEVLDEAVSYQQRRDLAFLGGYLHSPNVDGVLWFVEKVMPVLRKELPGVRLHVYGADLPDVLKKCACEDVIIDGFVEDVAEVYDTCRIFIAPLRYGAGLKGKVAGALARGVPCVLSPFAAEGFSLEDSPAAMIVRNPKQWVAAIKKMYLAETRWNAASRAALDYSGSRFNHETNTRRMGKIIQTLLLENDSLHKPWASDGLDSLLLFVHIPKTAGTSFREGLLRLYSRRDVLFDYGPHAEETDQCIKLLYGQNPFNLKKVIEIIAEKKIKLLCGHFPYGRYARAFPLARVVAFVREPLQRCYSEFLHLQRHKGYEKSFQKFFEQPRQVNLQSKWLAGIGDNALVGVSEHYEQSIKMINETLDCSLPFLFLNTHRKNIDEPYPLDTIGKKIIDRFYAMNQEDVQLYKQISSRFQDGIEEVSSFRRSFRKITYKLRSCSLLNPS
ncbi:glycosyltransferase [Thermodesulfobacteriota bacterium]